jgi:hypothetical protein
LYDKPNWFILHMPVCLLYTSHSMKYLLFWFYLFLLLYYLNKHVKTCVWVFLIGFLTNIMLFGLCTRKYYKITQFMMSICLRAERNGSSSIRHANNKHQQYFQLKPNELVHACCCITLAFSIYLQFDNHHVISAREF